MFKRGAGVDAEQRNLRFNGMTVGQPCVSGKLGEHFLVVCLLIVSTTSGIFLAAFPPQSFPLVPLISQDCPFWLENQIPLLHPEKRVSFWAFGCNFVCTVFLCIASTCSAWLSRIKA